MDVKEKSIILGAHNKNEQDVIKQMVDKHYQCGYIQDKEIFKKVLQEKELPALAKNGVVIFYGKSETVQIPSIVIMVDKGGVKLKSNKEMNHIFLMLAMNENQDKECLQLIDKLNDILSNETLVHALLKAISPKQFIKILNGEIKIEKKEVYQQPNRDQELKKNDLPIEEITQIEIQSTEEKALSENTSHQSEISKQEQVLESPKEKNKLEFKNIILQFIEPLKNAITNIIPILMILGIIQGIVQFYDMNYMQIDGEYLIHFIEILKEGLRFASPFGIILLSAYIAESIGGKSAFAVSLFTYVQLIGITTRGSVSYSSFGPITIVSDIVFFSVLMGYMTGYLTRFINKICSHLPVSFDNFISYLLTPIAVFIIVTAMNIIIYLNFGDTFLSSNSSIVGNSAQWNGGLGIVIGIVLGIMMAIDIGGILKDIAYTIGVLGIISEQYMCMSAIMIAGMVPPIMIGLAMLLFPKIFKADESKRKWTCIIKGLCFDEKEAFSYMKRDRKGIHIPCIIASAIAGGLSIFFECSQALPQGGIFTLPFINNFPLFIIALIASVLIGMTLIIILHKSED